MSKAETPPPEPTVVQVVGTAEFQQAHGDMVELLTSLLCSKTENPQVMGHPGPDMKLVLEKIDECCRQAYLDGFHEGLCK